MDYKEMKEYISEGNETMLFVDGFDEALLGLVNIAGPSGSYEAALYDKDLCINILMRRDGMTEEEAVEYFEYNIANAYVGRGTPAFARIVPIEEV
ncbi:hypothetical protein N374_gp012 [Bacillus phage phiNIT1]|uniref:Uncharacterized protein n=1 Tax=Bacillus phage phiNIT1 TaxID=207656 RepID=S6ATX7_9CAUD|nr:hypothetical protein N374_gp012 [Bacillus phage phiNIT1]BAN59681.1 hypothetical protein [Bacillus phage phiNIT1]